MKQFIYSGIISISTLVLLFTVMLAPHVYAAAVDTPLDCDTNAVLYCGGTTTREIHSKYNDSPDAQAIYDYFGISDWNVKNLTKNAVVGTVTQGGRVLVDGKEVATDVVTAGRINMAGSKTVTHSGVTFYVRPPGVSLQQNLPAFVVLNKDGTMKHAIIASCGNPVMTTKKEQPAPEQPKPERPKPQAAAPVVPAVAVSNTVVVQQQQQQQQQQTPPPAPQPQPQPVAPQPVAVTPVATLPKTGAAEVIQLTALAAIGATVAHMLYVRRKNRSLDV